MRTELDFPPGFRFHPTDEELVNHYLCRKCAGQPISVPVIAEIDLYKYDPWQLPDLALYGEKEWYFFSPRDRKYPNGSRPNRAAGSGYWKATGADKPIGKPKPLGIKKALVFYAGKAPKGIKTNWIMHEYRLANVDRSASKNKNNLRLDDWVLCRLYNKKGTIEKYYPTDAKPSKFPKTEDEPDVVMTGQKNLASPPTQTSPVDDLLHTDISGCTEHVSSPEDTCEKEVQSQPNNNGFDTFDNFGFGSYMDCLQDNPFGNQMDQIAPFQDVFMDIYKPF